MYLSCHSATWVSPISPRSRSKNTTRIHRVELMLLGHPDGITPDLRQDEGALQSFIEEDVHQTSFLSSLFKWIVIYGHDVSKSKLCNIFRINAALSTKEPLRYYLTGEDKVFFLIIIDNIIAVLWIYSCNMSFVPLFD